MMMNMCVEISSSSVKFFLPRIQRKKVQPTSVWKHSKQILFIDNPLELDKVLILSLFFKLFVNV